jgi:hypothetical protein
MATGSRIKPKIGEAHLLRAALIAGVLYVNNNLTCSFITSIVSSWLNPLSAQGFRVVCQILFSIGSPEFQFTTAPNKLDEGFLTLVYGLLEGHLFQHANKKVDKHILDRLRSRLLLASDNVSQ